MKKLLIITLLFITAFTKGFAQSGDLEIVGIDPSAPKISLNGTSDLILVINQNGPDDLPAGTARVNISINTAILNWVLPITLTDDCGGLWTVQTASPTATTSQIQIRNNAPLVNLAGCIVRIPVKGIALGTGSVNVTSTVFGTGVSDPNGVNQGANTEIIVVAPPIAVPDVVTTPAGTPATITATTNDTPGSAAIDPASVKLIDPITNMPVTSVTVPGQGTYTVNPSGTITFTPVTGFTGPATPVSYTVADVDGLVSNPAAITVTVSAIPPTAVPDVVTTPAGSPLIVTTIANDTPGSAPIDPTSVKLIDPITNTPVTSVTVPGQGTYTVNPDGTVTFTPVPGFTGTATPVSYTVKDVNGVVSNPAPITVTVSAIPPTAVPDVVTTPAGSPLIVTITANDTPGSAPIDPTSVKLTDPVSGLPVTSVTVPGQGTYTVNPDGTVTFTPVPGFTGTATPVSYTEKDVNGVVSNPAAITVTVTAIAPTANGDSGTALNGAPVTVAVLTNDIPGSSPLDPTTVKLIDPNTGTPSTSVTIPGEGTYTVDPVTGAITFTPDPAITTPITSTITYTVKDTDGTTSNPGTITINATPLPVTLTSFTVAKEGKVALLNWSTTAETNSDRFEIQHSLTGKNWNKIGTVASNGESTVKKDYSFTDKNVANGENLYRLKMIDKDATFAYSRIQSIKFDGLNAAAVSIFPNPSTDRVFVQDMDLAQIKQVSIMDMNGRAVFSTNTVTSNGINVSKFNPGTYILHITSINGSVSNHKIVIVK